MAHHARKLHRRAPRYRIGQGDPDSIKFLHLDNKKIVAAKIYDISETGIGLVVSSKLAPRSGEVIKVEFTPPGGFQIATLAQVIRLDRSQSGHSRSSSFPDSVKVGISYHGLPAQYQRMLRDRMQAILGNGYNRLKAETMIIGYKELWIVQHLWSVIVSFMLIVGLFWGISYLSKVEGENKANTKANNSEWAEGFFKKVVPKNRD